MQGALIVSWEASYLCGSVKLDQVQTGVHLTATAAESRERVNLSQNLNIFKDRHVH